MAQASTVESTPVVPTLTEFERGVIDIFVRLADVLGIPKSVGEIYGLLFASVQPLAFQDIIDRLDMSKGSASQGLRLLRSTGAIKLVYVASDRRNHFEPETEVRTLLAGFVREKIQPHLESGTMRVKALQALPTLTGPDVRDAEANRLLRRRLDKLSTWHKKGRVILPLITKFMG